MEIRAMQPSDHAAALALNNGNVPALNELDAPELARLAGMAVAALAAEVDGAFAGFCIVLPPGADYDSLNYGWFSRRYNDFVYLDRIVVDPTFRRDGIGRAFYTDLVARFTGVAPVLLCEVNVRPRNEPSLLFHHSIGFREVGQQETDGGNKTVSLLALPLG
ncbi:MAG: GNAT family N-acetyltransferase [Ilumatobacteraceae bacterium]